MNSLPWLSFRQTSCGEVLVNQLIDYFKHQFHRPRTGVIAGIGIAFLLIASIIGISDHPPGIAMSYLGLFLLTLALTHHWDRPREYGTLLAVAAISFPVLVLLHNICDTINHQIGVIPVLNQLLGGIAVISFILAVFVVPAVVVVSVVGGLYRLIRK